MNSATPTPLNHESDLFPVARIDTTDPEYILPIREFFETNGVRVMVNERPNTDVLYHIAAGDEDFVKQIFSSDAHHAPKRLGVIVGYKDQRIQAEGMSAKLYLTDPAPLTKNDTARIAALLFMNESNFIDARTKSRPTNERSPAADAARIQSIMSDVFSERKRTRHLKRGLPGVMGAFGLVLGLLIASIAWYIASVLLAATMIVWSVNSLSQGNEKTAAWQLAMSSHWKKQGAFVLRVWSLPLSMAGATSQIREQERVLSFLEQAQRADFDTQQVVPVGKRVAAGILNQVDVTSTGKTSASDITKLRIALSDVGTSLGLVQAELQVLLDQRTFPFSVGRLRSLGERGLTTLESSRVGTQTLDRLLTLFLGISGFSETNTYLVLFQNSLELRPTGGFIGSVGVATFTDGHMTNFTIDDVYTFDGQLKGHVDPPIPIREFILNEHWYLRDSNWDPDFKQSATRAAWFFEKETGKVVDGVIAINVPFVVALLEASGPIELPDYNERITAENFYGKSLYYTKEGFFPGSTQKKDFLGSLARGLIEKTTTDRAADPVRLFSAITKALDKHDILFMFTNNNLQSSVEYYGWAGRVEPITACPFVASYCTQIPLAVVEANLGVNKASYFMKRTIARSITIDQDGSVGQSITITLHNTSAGDTAQPYRAYIRAITPPLLTPDQVLVGERVLPMRKPEDAQPPMPYAELTTGVASGSAVGIALELPAGSQIEMTVRYKKKRLADFGPGGWILELVDYKQPGVDDTNETVTISYPEAWTAGIESDRRNMPVEFIANVGRIEYNMTLDQTRTTRLRFTQ